MNSFSTTIDHPDAARFDAFDRSMMRQVGIIVAPPEQPEITSAEHIIRGDRQNCIAVLRDLGEHIPADAVFAAFEKFGYPMVACIKRQAPQALTVPVIERLLRDFDAPFAIVDLAPEHVRMDERIHALATAAEERFRALMAKTSHGTDACRAAS